MDLSNLKFFETGDAQRELMLSLVSDLSCRERLEDVDAFAEFDDAVSELADDFRELALQEAGLQEALIRLNFDEMQGNAIRLAEQRWNLARRYATLVEERTKVIEQVSAHCTQMIEEAIEHHTAVRLPLVKMYEERNVERPGEAADRAPELIEAQRVISEWQAIARATRSAGQAGPGLVQAAHDELRKLATSIGFNQTTTTGT